MSSQTITEKKLLKQFTETKYAANRAANQSLQIAFKWGYLFSKRDLKNEQKRL